MEKYLNIRKLSRLKTVDSPSQIASHEASVGYVNRKDPSPPRHARPVWVPHSSALISLWTLLLTSHVTLKAGEGN